MLDTPLKFISSSLKMGRGSQKERLVFRPSFFRGELLNFRGVFHKQNSVTFKKASDSKLPKRKPSKVWASIYIYKYLYTYTYIYIYMCMSFCEICWDVFFGNWAPENNFPQGIMWPMIGKYLSSFAFRCGESVGFFLLPSNGDHQGLVTLPLDFLQFY